MSRTDETLLPRKLKAAAKSASRVVAKAEGAATGEAEWLRPISAIEPCGSNLEYDAEYAVLMARLAPQSDAQYGSFVDKPDLPDWAEVERDCRRLLLRSKDINILIWLARCRTRLGGAAGLSDVLTMLAQVLELFPDDVHPQLEIEGEADPEVRANALAALADPQGLMSDVREVVVSASTAFRLTVKDVERAFAVPRLADALPADAVRQQLDDLRWRHNAHLESLRDSSALVQRIDRWSRDRLHEDAPALQPLLRLLAPFDIDDKVAHAAVEAPHDAAVEVHVEPAPAAAPPAIEGAPVKPASGVAPAPEAGIPAGAGTPAFVPAIGTQLNIAAQRDQVRAYIREAKEWLEQHEPSSPVAILLKQAERLVGKRFAEVAQAIPPELLAKWDVE